MTRPAFMLLAGRRSSRSSRGVALIITLILLSVITFLAVTFLAVSNRERGAVVTQKDQTTAHLAADTALERVKAQVIATMLANTNPNNFGPFVSTNYINWDGFDNNPPNPSDPRTNVNFGYLRNGNPLGPNEVIQNLAHLQFDPRPPVYITNLAAANSTEFRFYRDENRNGRYDTNGFWPVIGPNGGFVHTNGLEDNNPINSVSNRFLGDPEWIGILERPEYPHSATNLFVARYAFNALPIGNTLDVNYMFNQALAPAGAPSFSADYYLRNQGVGTFELNLGAFLYDLNTNTYAWGPTYAYNPFNPPTAGTAFLDATRLYQYRVNNLSLLSSVHDLYGANGDYAFITDQFDGYSDGSLLQQPVAFNADTVQDQYTRGWSGAPNRNHFFTAQDFFDRTKTQIGVVGVGFSDRLTSLGNLASSYDRYTYQRMMSQMAVDSAPEDPGKISVNYIDIGGWSPTNFVSWGDPRVQFGGVTQGGATIPGFNRPGVEVFFTNAVDKLLRRFTDDWNSKDAKSFKAAFGVTKAFGVTDIPVWMNGSNTYSPSIHRLLQMAANILDATTNRSSYYNGYDLPSVFRPVLKVTGTNVFITDFKEAGSEPDNSPYMRKPRDLANPADFAAVAASPETENVYGVPWVIGAKKGLPNFNEFAMRSTFQLTRKLQLQRATTTEKGMNGIVRLLYSLNLSNTVGLEVWNSSTNPFNRALEIAVDADTSLSLTNDDGAAPHVPLRTYTNSFSRTMILPAGKLAGYKQGRYDSFTIPYSNIVALLPEAIYNPVTRSFLTDPNVDFKDVEISSGRYIEPNWGLNSTNHLRVFMRDTASGRIIDYVQLSGLDAHRDLFEEIRTHGFADTGRGTQWNGVWNTNRPPGTGNTLPFEGMTNQIYGSMGSFGNPPVDQWKNYQVPGGTIQQEMTAFRNFYLGVPGNTNLIVQAPFSPSARYYRNQTWQANDPLVHYLAGDLVSLTISSPTNGLGSEPLALKDIPMPKNLGQVNDRYSPWGGNPNKSSEGETSTEADAYDVARKDPGIKSSDYWQFPTNKLPNIGWLGRIHRGTPWQTVYMKSSDVKAEDWRNWTGNGNAADAAHSSPVNDRLLFDVFTTAINDDSTRGQLSVNQPGLAAWSAVLSGVVALTNSSTAVQLNANPSVVRYDPVVIQPAGPFNAFNANSWPPLQRIVDGINRERERKDSKGNYVHAGGSFETLGDVLSVPELTDKSPFINTNGVYLQKGINDAAYEWLPQQIMGLLRFGTPRYVIYSYGQTLRPAPHSKLTSGPFLGMCTNYQITAEIATRTVLRIESTGNLGSPNARPRVVVESFNILPPD